jgi:hypothetical protein
VYGGEPAGDSQEIMKKQDNFDSKTEVAPTKKPKKKRTKEEKE